jgi:nitroimidazol reductase NimA-like FMN-containing flavoprotein (pyridoxamine 5'-phosphate oxidase superfamily)
VSDLADLARGVVDGNRYLALGTADAAGTPWVSPVFFAHRGYADFYWASAPDTRHSRNIAARADVSIAIYDSRVPIGQAEAVYLTATAAQVPDSELDAAALLFNARLPAAQHLAAGELRAPAPFRLYRATAVEHSVLIRGGDPRYGRGADSRMTVRIGGSRPGR